MSNRERIRAALLPRELAFGETIRSEFGLNADITESISLGNGVVARPNEEINRERNRAGQGAETFAGDRRGYDA